MNNHNYLIVCISDIHVESRNYKVINQKFEELINRIQSLISLGTYEQVVFLLPGDIAFSGKAEEYILLKEHLSKLSSFGDVFIAPGNHDHDFSSYNDPGFREQAIKYTIKEDKFESDSFVQSCSGQEHFFSFLNELNNNDLVNGKPSLSREIHLKSDIFICSLNTSWCSKLNEKSGELFFPVHYLKSNSTSKLNIAMFHHPLSWFEANNSKSIRNKLLDHFDLVVTGHEHLADGLKVSRDESQTIFVENLPFHDQSIGENGFCYIEAGLGYVRVFKTIWNGDKFVPSTILNEVDFLSKTRNIKGSNRERFLTDMNDIGANINHPIRGKINLSDIFIYPNISPKLSGKNTLSRISSSSIGNDIFSEYNKILVLGEESSGKSTLLRKLYLDLVEKGYKPLIVGPEIVSKSSKFKISNVLSAVQIQYDVDNIVDYLELPGKKVVLIDDFDQARTSSAGLENVFIELEKLFDGFILCASDTFEFSNSSLNPLPKLSEFKIFDLLRFGYQLRYELINKWNLLDEKIQSDKQSLILANDSANKLFDTVLAKGVIPSLPLFLMTMLQSISSNDANDPNTSTYGYYYQFLITSAMGSIGITKEQLDELFQYLSELAFYSYIQDVKTFDEPLFDSFNSSIKSKYGISFESKSRINKLVAANIISNNEGLYSFKYQYIYFFFLAKYLANNLDDYEELIIGIIDGIYIKKNMNILMFLTHHSKSKKIFEGIINKSRSLLQDVHPIDFDSGINFVTEMMNSEVLIEYKEELKDPEEFRRKRALRKDDRFQEQPDVEDDGQEDVPDFFKQVLSSFKATELLSQIAKNYYGSLEKSRKEILIKEAIEGPLRALEAIIVHFRSDPERLVQYVKGNIKRLEEHTAISDVEAERIAREAIFNFLMTLSFSVLLKISTSISDKNISQIIGLVCDGDQRIAFKMINFFSKLETGTNISPDELKRLCQLLNKNKLAITLLRAFVLRYLYLFEARISRVQSLCKIAGINYGSVSKKIGVERLKVNKATN